MKTKTSITTLLATAILATGLSVSAFAKDYDSSTDHNHGGNNSDTSYPMNMPKDKPMQNEKMKAMQAEMQTIIDTEDASKRKALFEAHKVKMKGMMKNMHANCHGDKDGMKGKMSQQGKTEIDHQAETD